MIELRAARLAALALLSLPAFAAASEYGREQSAEPTQLEVRALRAARAERSGPLGVSPSLMSAARELAARAAAGASDPISRTALRAALARAGAADPAPAAILAVSSPQEAPRAAARALGPGFATHLGAGAVVRGARAFVVLIASERHVALSPFPRDVEVGARAVLKGALSPPLSGARVFVSRPSGEVSEVGGGSGRAFSAGIDFPVPGRFVVEVIGEGDGGPEVAALLVVSSGGARFEAPARTFPGHEPTDKASSEEAVLRALNATRALRGLDPVAAAADLGEIARRHAEAMAASGRAAHVVPGSPNAAERLRLAGVPFRRVYENVARAASALDAQAVLEESPAHLANVLQPDAALAGVGVVRSRGPSGVEEVYLCEVLIAPPDDLASSRLTPDARVREELWRERARLGLPPLTADPALDALAREAVASMRARDETETDGLADRALALRRKLAAVDVFVGSGPEDAVRSANLKDARFRRVGVGVQSGDSARFGKGRLWIAVVYTD